MFLGAQVEVLLSATLGTVLRRAGEWRSAGHSPVLSDLPPPGAASSGADTVSSLPVLHS